MRRLTYFATLAGLFAIELGLLVLFTRRTRVEPPPPTCAASPALLAAAPPPHPLDADDDGVPDGADECPDRAEDLDAFEDADGCPEPDNDKDGVPDADDDCPNEAVLSRVDTRGCQIWEEPVSWLPKPKALPAIRKQIQFEDGRWEVKRGWLPVLDAIANDIKRDPVRYPTVVVQGRAHWDERGPKSEWWDAEEDRPGTSARAKRLAVARGQAVTALLIGRGVPPHRLSAVGIHPSSSYESGPIGRLVTFLVPNPGRQPGAVPDRDGDQIPDPWDNCPNDAEVFNEFWDDDGCPDRPCDPSRTYQLEPVLFEKNGTALTPDATAWLEGIANTLLARPNVGWVDVKGESAADEPEGEHLARARAETVRAFLVSRNVKPGKLFAVVGDRYWECKGRTKACLDENRMVWFSHSLGPVSDRR